MFTNDRREANESHIEYYVKEKIETELESLVSENIFQPVEYSEWASPIVLVKNSDGSIIICGDYKVSINKVAKHGKYPVPKTEDLLTTLNGGKRFSKLYLSHAYQQLLLYEDSKELLTVNTHKGFLQPSR